MYDPELNVGVNLHSMTSNAIFFLPKGKVFAVYPAAVLTLQVDPELMSTDEQYPRLKPAAILQLVTDPSALMLLVYLAIPREKAEPGTGKRIIVKGPFTKLLKCERWCE